MSDMDEIQAIFFAECSEGLADGDRSDSTIAAVFRAVHSIKGGSRAFGHNG